MTFINRFAFATLFAAASAATVPGYAFMADAGIASAVDGSDGLTQSVEAIRQELHAGKTTCGEMLAKIDAAIEQIDAVLDKGVVDETKYLGLRDELVELRLALPCVANDLAKEHIVNSDMVAEAAIVEPVALGDSVMIEDTGLVSPGYGGMSSSGGFAMSGGGAGGGTSGAVGGSGGLLALGAIGAAVALGVTDDDDDTPGENPSPSE